MATQLVPLPEIERLSPSVIRILGGNPGKFTLQGTNTYIVGTGKQRLLIDTGEGKLSWIRAIKETLSKENATITRAIITHWHHDHVGGVKDLLEISPQTKVYKHKPLDGQLDIEDGQVFETEGASLRALFSPGHTQDHMALVLEGEDAMFTGDNVLGHGTAVFEDLLTYLHSLDKMRTAFGGRAYPGHGAVVEDGPAKIVEYIQHRKLREDQVIQVLKSSKGSSTLQAKESGQEPDQWTSMEIVKIIYKDVPENLHAPAEGGILQILAKLSEEEKVVEEVKKTSSDSDSQSEHQTERQSTSAKMVEKLDTPNVAESMSDTQVADAFTKYYMQRATKEFSEDLDLIRGAGDFKDDALPILINALQQGTTIFSISEQRRIAEATKEAEGMEGGS
ncbi:hypothetical protein B7463_g12118, partial [Scytalidium lignicola]